MAYRSVSINPQQAIAQIQQAKQLGLQDASREIDFLKGNLQSGMQLGGDIANYLDRKAVLDQLSSQQEQLGAAQTQQSQAPIDPLTLPDSQQEQILASGGLVDEQTEGEFVADTQGAQEATQEELVTGLAKRKQKLDAQGKDSKDTQDLINVAVNNPEQAKLAISNINQMLQNKAYRRMLARDPAAAKDFAGSLGIDTSGRGKDFADKAVFTTRVRDDGSIEQGFAVYDPDSKKTTFEAIEGKGLKETAKDKREQDLKAKKELERYKTDQAFIREMNSQTRTPKGKLELAKSRVESEQLKANKAAKTARADNAIDMLQRLEGMDLDKIYGRGESIYPELMRSQEGIDAIADRSQLISILKIMGRGELKGQGTVSDFEAKMLGDAATILGNPDISAVAARREIDRIKQTFTDLANGIDYENGSPISGSKPKAQTQKKPASSKYQIEVL